MSIYVLKTKQKLPISITDAWDFFSNPENLNKITPKNMDFKITSGINDDSENPLQKMFPGMIIIYTVKPVLNIPLTWVTEITQMSEPNYFIDEQRFGPYKFWHHKHFFKEIKEGVEMFDVVHYKIKFGLLGTFANPLFVKKELKKIFDYRFNVLEDMFGKTM